MTVAQNVAFPLRARKYPSRAINGRVADALGRVGLQGFELFELRRPHQVSGGQQQRVALARAIAAETQLLLLDEPLSALDPATRSSVRGELSQILRNLHLTTIIVTHDREEAFELADRIAVLVDGEIQQCAVPEEVYERPANITVARFMGVNLLSLATLLDAQAQSHGPPSYFQLPNINGENPSHIAIVPERTSVVNPFAGVSNVIPGQLVKTQYRGGEYRLQVRVGGGDASEIIDARSKAAPPSGEQLFIHLPVEAIHIIPQSHPGTQRVNSNELLVNRELTALKEETA
jgi:ABC-type Fe3+/spermidine/putrescine transport system ATPase subunit